MSWPCQELPSDPVARFFQPGSVGSSSLEADVELRLNDLVEAVLALQLKQELGRHPAGDDTGFEDRSRVRADDVRGSNLA